MYAMRAAVLLLVILMIIFILDRNAIFDVQRALDGRHERDSLKLACYLISLLVAGQIALITEELRRVLRPD